MSAEEYGYWQAEYMRHPWGDYVQELGAGLVCSTIANANRGKDSRAFKISDFMPLSFRNESEVEVDRDPGEVFNELNKQNG